VDKQKLCQPLSVIGGYFLILLFKVNAHGSNPAASAACASAAWKFILTLLFIFKEAGRAGFPFVPCAQNHISDILPVIGARSAYTLIG
jgi:hypothetical protein